MPIILSAQEDSEANMGEGGCVEGSRLGPEGRHQTRGDSTAGPSDLSRLHGALSTRLRAVANKCRPFGPLRFAYSRAPL